MVDYVRYWKGRTELPAKQLLRWIGVPEGTFYKWRERHGKANEHNGWIPRDHWLLDSEKKAILDFHWKYPLEGYRRLTYMMLDRNIVAVSPSSVYRVLKAAGVMERFNRKPSKKVRLHGALKYVTPQDKLLGCEQAIYAERDRKLEEARERRAQQRAADKRSVCYNRDARPEDKALLASNLSAVPGPEASEGGHLSPSPSSALLLAQSEKRNLETLPLVH